MKIDKYYRDAGKSCLNRSLAVLFPAGLIMIGNLSIFHNRGLMLWTLPFFICSLLYFQRYLWRNVQFNGIRKNLYAQSSPCDSVFQVEHLLIFMENTLHRSLLLYFPDGHLAGKIKRYRAKGIGLFSASKKFALYDFHGSLLGIYIVKGRQRLKIEVFEQTNKYIGCFERKRYTLLKEKKELLDDQGRFVGAVEGSLFFMDEHFLDSHSREFGRLRRGWMPVQWSNFFPEPNTPVLTLGSHLSKQEKLLQFSYLIYEYFIPH